MSANWPRSIGCSSLRIAARESAKADFGPLLPRIPFAPPISIALLSLLLAAPGMGMAQDAGPLAAARVDEHLGARLPLDLRFTAESGAPVRLGDAFAGGKPVVLVMAWYHCTMLCPLVLRGAAEAARRSSLAPGTDYTLLTVSIDPRDRPADAASVARGLRSAAARPGIAGGWRFWTGDEASVRALADGLGFRYRWDAASRQFAHAAVAFVVGPDGRISNYMYGTTFPPEQWDASLRLAADGGTGTPFERFLLRCFHYTPALRRYGWAVMDGLRATAVLILAAAVGGLAMLGRRAARAREAA